MCRAHLHCCHAAAVLKGGQARHRGLPHNLVAAVSNHQVDDGQAVLLAGGREWAQLVR